MPHKGGRKRTTPRKAYAQKAAQKQAASQSGSGFSPKAGGTKSSTFSMSDAARNTEHRGAWGEKTLRHTRINFVSATSADTAFQALDKSEGDDAEANGPSSDDRPAAEYDQDDEDAEEPSAVDAKVAPDAVSVGASENDSRTARVTVDTCTSSTTRGDTLPRNGLFFVDSVGDPTLKPSNLPASEHVVIADSNKDDSDPSEEEVVFVGRKHTASGRRKSPHKNQNVRIVEEDIRAITLNDTRVPQPAPAPEAILAKDKQELPQASPEDAAVADYVANLLAQEGGDQEPGAGTLTSELEGPGPEDSTMNSEYDTIDGSEDSEDDNSEDDDEDEDPELSDEIDSEDQAPDETQLDRAALAMSDEQLARRLAKQEELGLGSSEVLLWGEADLAGVVEEEDEEDTTEFTLQMLRVAAQKLSGSHGKRSTRRNKSLLPTMLGELDAAGEDFGDFDVMDFDRPSLQRRGKGSKSKGLPFQLSDSELEANMAVAWENDRVRKKQRKQQREELRAEGLIAGGKGTKHASEVSTTQISEQLREFLRSTETRLDLPPMDKRSRKAIHEIANRLNLRSKSAGKGDNRYPCLFKTSRTLAFDPTMVDAMLRRFGAGKSSGYKGAGGGRWPKPQGRIQRGGGGGGGVTSGVTYRDGETVGASAPALGVENRGHAMLAKMGWTLGTGLGAGGAGSLEPVPHVVKSSRAGLG